MTQVSTLLFPHFSSFETVKRHMDRRTFLGSCSGVAVISIAGCGESNGDESTTPDENGETSNGTSQEENGHQDIEQDPMEALDELRDAVEDEDIDRFGELLHSDSPAKQELDDFEPGLGEALEVAMALHEPPEDREHVFEDEVIAEHELIEETGTEAAICGQHEDGDPIARFDFRAEDGKWRLWDASHIRLSYYPDEPEAFEECGKLVIRINRLPEPARVEAETALEDGRYTTDDEPYLPHLLDPEESYLAVEEDDERTEYQLRVEQDGDTTFLELEKTIASWGEEPLTIRNDTDESVTIDIRVERNRTDEIVVDETLTIDPNSEAETDAFDREFGSYTATIEAGEFDEEIDFFEGENELPTPGMTITPDGISPEPSPMLEPIDCQNVWEEPVEFSEDCEPIRD